MVLSNFVQQGDYEAYRQLVKEASALRMTYAFQKNDDIVPMWVYRDPRDNKTKYMEQSLPICPPPRPPMKKKCIDLSLS
jgi:hypothetical protein